MMKTTLLAAALLVFGLSGAVYAKCGGSSMQQGNMQGDMQGDMMEQKGRMMMNGNMEHDKGMMMQHLDTIKMCVNNAKTSKELNGCNQRMRKDGPMMQKQMKQKSDMPMNSDGNR